MSEKNNYQLNDGERYTSQVVGWISAALSCLVYPSQEEKWLIRPRFLWHEATRSISTPPPGWDASPSLVQH